MRLDKFLWSVRFYKTRNISAEEIKKNRVSIGGQIVKASREVKEGEIIEIRKNQINYKIKIIQIPKSRVGAKLVALYVVYMTEKEQYELLKLIKLSLYYYRQIVLGRQTKKDRRDMDNFIDSDEFWDDEDDEFFLIDEM